MKHLQYLKSLKKRKGNLKEKNMKSLSKIHDLLKPLEWLGGSICTESKESINASINNDLIGSRRLLEKEEKNIERFGKTLLKARNALGKLLTNPQLEVGEFQNIYSKIENLEKDFLSAKEEFFEAKILYSYLQNNKIKLSELPLVDFETYAGALSDFCGELLRRAKLDVINKKVDSEKEIRKYYEYTQGVYRALANFGFSNKSGVRSKVENLKRHISGFEKVLYDLAEK